MGCGNGDSGWKPEPRDGYGTLTRPSGTLSRRERENGKGCQARKPDPRGGGKFLGRMPEPRDVLGSPTHPKPRPSDARPKGDMASIELVGR